MVQSTASRGAWYHGVPLLAKCDQRSSLAGKTDHWILITGGKNNRGSNFKFEAPKVLRNIFTFEFFIGQMTMTHG